MRYVVMTLLVLFLVGCASTPTKVQVTGDPIEKELKDRMDATDAIADILSPMEEITKGQEATDYILIKNAYDKETSFNLNAVCDPCFIKLEKTRTTIPAGGTVLVKVSIEGHDPVGQYSQMIKITDDLDNTYAMLELLVVVS